MLGAERERFTIRLAVGVEASLIALQDRFCDFPGSDEATLRAPRNKNPEILLPVLHRGHGVVVDLQPFEIPQHVGGEPLRVAVRTQRRSTGR